MPGIRGSQGVVCTASVSGTNAFIIQTTSPARHRDLHLDEQRHAEPVLQLSHLARA